MAGHRNALIIDDDENLRRIVDLHLKKWGFKVCQAVDLGEAREQLLEQPFELVLLDVQLPDGEGTVFLSELREAYPNTQVIMASAHGDIEMALDAVRSGAFDFIPKPLDVDRLEFAVRNAMKLVRADREVAVLRDVIDGRDQFGELLGSHPNMQAVYEIIENVAESDCPVLIMGETGTGKELVAAEIHHRSQRRARDLVPVNCAAIPKELLESEMFGHEKGAFTGANARKIGAAERADRSTLFLDELAEMPMALQSKMLRFLQDFKVQRVGGSEVIPVDVRIVCATNRDPQKMVEAEKLREDLLYRVNVVRIHLPSLRERITDLPLLASVFLRRAAEQHRKFYTDIESDALDAFMAYDWPGNIRQLQNVITEIVVLNKGDTVTADMIPADIRQAVSDGARRKADVTNVRAHVHVPPIWQMEKELIIRAIARCRGNVTEAARILEIGKATIYRKIKEYDISIDRSKDEA